jgi:purine-binding chemotaxis protein CheW
MTTHEALAIQGHASTEGVVSIRVGGQTFGVPVLRVQDVIAQTAISRVPLGPPEVAGSLNLRGRIVTAIDTRQRLRMEPRRPEDGFMSVIVERNGELYALLVDDVGDVLWLPQSTHEAPPITLAAEWRGLCSGLHRLEGDLLLVLNIDEVLTLSRQASAPPVPAASVGAPEQKGALPLYERLGGAAAVTAAVDSFYRKVLADPHLGRFFREVDMERQAGKQRAFLTMLMGGPNNYTGKNLRLAHRHMVADGLDDSHFDAVVGHLAATLTELGASPSDVGEAGALAQSARADVLGR